MPISNKKWYNDKIRAYFVNYLGLGNGLHILLWNRLKYELQRNHCEIIKIWWQKFCMLSRRKFCCKMKDNFSTFNDVKVQGKKRQTWSPTIIHMNLQFKQYYNVCNGIIMYSKNDIQYRKLIFPPPTGSNYTFLNVNVKIYSII